MNSLHYHQALIHAHRPFISRHSIQPPSKREDGFLHARKRCIDSAIAIAKLLHLYERYFTFRRMNIQAVAITCSAALMLIFAKGLGSRPLEDEKTTAQHLNVCFRALEEFGYSWECARRAQNFLLHMQGFWKTQAQSDCDKKRQHGSHPLRTSQGPSPKRPRYSCPSTSTIQNAPIESLEGTDGRPALHSEELDWLWVATTGMIPSR